MGICCFFAVFLSLRCPFQGLALRPMLLARPPPAPSVSCRAPPCNPAAPFEKGVDPKTFLRMGNILSMEGQRTRNAGTVVFRVPVYGHRAPSPLWVFCAFVHGGRHLPKAFGFFDDASRLHDLKRLCLFRRDEVSARNTHRPSGFAFTHLKKFLRVPRVLFFKNAPLAGCGTASHKRRGQASLRGAPFQAGRHPIRRRGSKGSSFLINMLYKFGEREKRRCLSCLYGQPR